MYFFVVAVVGGKKLWETRQALNVLYESKSVSCGEKKGLKEQKLGFGLINNSRRVSHSPPQKFSKGVFRLFLRQGWGVFECLPVLFLLLQHAFQVAQTRCGVGQDAAQIDSVVSLRRFQNGA